MAPPLPSTKSRPAALNFPPHMSSGASVASQLQSINDSYKSGLISPDERRMWKDQVISSASGGRAVEVCVMGTPAEW